MAEPIAALKVLIVDDEDDSRLLIRHVLGGAGYECLEAPDAETGKRKDNYVEMEFSALTDQPYRAWAYVGFCCSESLVFYAQTSDLAGAEPGSEPELPVKHAFTSATRTHTGHSTRSGPAKWGWVEIPLPAAAS